MKSDFAEILSSLRRHKGLSQRQAAAQLGISQALLSHYENNTREPKLKFVVQACDYYGVSADYILGRVNDRSTQTIPLPHDCESAPRLVTAVSYISERLEELSDPQLYSSVMDYLVVPAENAAALLRDPFILYDPVRDAEQKMAEAAFVTQAQRF